jgi:hypothetical protein
MRPRKIISGRAAWAALAAVALLTGGVIVAGSAGSGPRPTFLTNCLALTAGLEDGKLARRERECRRREAASSGVTLAQALERKAQLRAHPQRAELAPSTRLTGLVNDRQGPAGTNQTFHSTSHWAGNVDGQWYIVYAGAAAAPDTNENTRPELRIYKEPTDLNSGEPNVLVGSYTPPGGGHQPLTIASASAGVLTIRTSTGAMLSFDVGQRVFS